MTFPHRLPVFLLALASVVSAQNAGMVQAAADRFQAQKQGLALTEAQRKPADLLQQEARRTAAAGRFADAMRAYAHATAVVRDVEWTPALDLASSLEARVDHLLLDPGQSVVLSLAPLYPTTQAAAAKLSATVFVAEEGKAAGRQLVRPIVLDPSRVPFTIRFSMPDLPSSNYSLEVRLAPADGQAPEILHDIFLKSVTVHVENLRRAAAILSERLARVSLGGPPKTRAALATAEYVLRFYECADRGEEGLRRFSRYPFGQQFAAAKGIMDDLAAGRDPFGAKRGDFHRAYLSTVDQTLQPYRLFVPDAYDGQRDFPLIVALHGVRRR